MGLTKRVVSGDRAGAHGEDDILEDLCNEAVLSLTCNLIAVRMYTIGWYTSAGEKLTCP